MLPEEELLIRRARELDGRGGRYRYLGFLTESEAALLEAMHRSGNLTDLALWGGYEDAVRVLARFGSAEDLGYEEPWPIARLILKSTAGRFSTPIGHRDVLGALMSLGIERDVLGDQVYFDGMWHLFCRQEMAPHVMTLTMVAACPVRVEEAPEGLALPRAQTERVRVNVPSLRADAVVAALTNMARGRAQEHFRRQEVRINGLVEENGSRFLKEGDTVSVKGFGKWRCLGVVGESKKGRQFLEADRFK